MDIMLQEHRTKFIYRVPDGLRELCSDISREVLRSQPRDIYCFIADYIDALLITRENAKVAMRVVQNITLDSESIISVLQKTGLSFKQIAIAAPRLQKTFRAYLDAVDIRPDENKADENLEKANHITIENILRDTGATLIDANRAATLIQRAFRGHYQQMLDREKKGEIQWQRAVINTMEILKKAGVSQSEAAKTATLIQSAYRGYYTRRNIKLKIEQEAEQKQINYLEPRETIQAVAWLEMMFDDSGLTKEQANEAAFIIQKAYKNYRGKKDSQEAPKMTSSRSLVVEAILDNLHQKVFNKILDRGDFPKDLGSREKLSESIEKVQSAYKELLRKSQYSEGEIEPEEEFIESEKVELIQKEVDYEEVRKEDIVEVERDQEKVGEKIEDQEVEGSKEDQEDQEVQEDKEDQEYQKDQKDQEVQEDKEDQEYQKDQKDQEDQEDQEDQRNEENQENQENREKEQFSENDHMDHEYHDQE